MDIQSVIALLSGVALFLFGMQIMGDGLKKVAGSKLEIVLYKLSSTPLKGVLLGTGVTAIIQSSSATSVMVVGFVNAGMMKVRQAIGIIMGAIIGTSVTGWILCLSNISGSGWVALLSTETLAGVVAVIGIILRMFCKNMTKRYVGDILIGFAVLMFGMQNMSEAVNGLRNSAVFIDMVVKCSNPFIGILVGILITAVLQSASATVGILQALAVTGAIDFSVALPIIMGIAVGAAMPVLLSSIGASTNGKRTAFIYLLVDALGVLIWAILFYSLNAIFRFSFMNMKMNMISIAFVNSLFRLGTVLILYPFVKKIEKLVEVLFPLGPDDGELAEIDSLEERFIGHPALAIAQSRTVLCSMARKSQKNLDRAISLLENFSQEEYETVQRKEDVIDRYEDKLGSYIVKITQQELTPEQNKEVSKFLHTISDFERIADHAINIAEAAKEMYEKKQEFSENGKKDMFLMQSVVKEIVNLVVCAFENNSLELACRTEPLEELIDGYCDEIKMNHIKRVQTGQCTLNQGFVFNDLLTDYERIADHCSNVAVAIIELEDNAFDTHEYLINLLNNRTDSFDKYFEEYKNKFPIID